MDLHPTPFPGTKAQSVRSKYKKATEAPKQKPKEAPPQRQRRTFGTIRNPNIPTVVPENPKTKPINPISQKQPKKESETATDSAKKSPENRSSNRAIPRKKKSVCFSEKLGESATKKYSPAKEVDLVQTPVRPPFSAKPVRNPATPYLSAEKCSSCRFDRLETASYWLGQIKSAETVGKHFVAAAFFRLAQDCKAEPVRNLSNELKRYLIRHEYLSTDIGWKEVSYRYGILKEENKINNDEEKKGDLILNNDSKFGEIKVDNNELKEYEQARVKEIDEQEK